MKRSAVSFMLALICLLAAQAQEKEDALKVYRYGRDLEAAGRVADAKATYSRAIEVCRKDLEANPKNMDAYSIIGWSLLRMGNYQEAVDASLEAMKVIPDYRVIETLGEGYFYLENYRESLKYMERYIDGAPRGERISTAYFFVGEIYRMSKKYNHADIAYTTACHLEPAISLWWFRLGTVRESLGDKKGAFAAYQSALKLRPDYKDASEGVARTRA